MFNIVLVHPEIPPNTGNIIRLCANNGCKLHLIEPLGFDLDEKSVRRAGMDYRQLTNVTVWPNFNDLATHAGTANIYSYSSKSKTLYNSARYTAGDYLIFGSETSGLPKLVSESVAIENRLHIPMHDQSRSLNLSNAVAIVSYEAWRQLAFETPATG